VTQLGQCRHIVVWLIEKYQMHSKSFCCSLSSRQSNGDIRSSLVPAFPSILYTPCHFQQTICDPPWQSTSLSISRLVVKRVLGMATYHMTENCPLIGVQYPVRQGQQLNTQFTRPFPPCRSGRLARLVSTLWSSRPSPSVFAYWKQSKNGGGNGYLPSWKISSQSTWELG